MKKKIVLIVVSILVLIAIAGVLYFTVFNKEKDSERFANEYGSVDKENVFVYRDINEIIKILEHGTGVVYLGFPECPWCKAYVTHLNEVAIDNDVEEIYYFNILEDRKNTTDGYKKIVSLLDEYLQYDKEGNKRVYVPAVIGVVDGEIVGFDDETSLDTKGYKTPAEYWENEDLPALKEKLTKMFKDTKKNICTTDCNK